MMKRKEEKKCQLSFQTASFNRPDNETVVQKNKSVLETVESQMERENVVKVAEREREGGQGGWRGRQKVAREKQRQRERDGWTS